MASAAIRSGEEVLRRQLAHLRGHFRAVLDSGESAQSTVHPEMEASSKINLSAIRTIATYFGMPLNFDVEDHLTQIGTGTTPTVVYRSDGLRAWTQIGNNRQLYFYDGDSVDFIGVVRSNPYIEISLSTNIDIGPTGPFGSNGTGGGGAQFGSTTFVFDPNGNACARIGGDNSYVYDASFFSAYGKYRRTFYSNGVATTPPATYNDVPYDGYKGAFGYFTDNRFQGLILCGQRWYDPGTGRWLTRDPIGYAGGINLYSYCYNNPIKFVDPDGAAPKRPPHKLTATITENGKTVSRGKYVSGGMTAAQKAMGYPKGSLDTHTEAKALRQQPPKSGQSMLFEGKYRACPSCKGKMNAMARSTGAVLKYEWMENGRLQTWIANAKRGSNKILPAMKKGGGAASKLGSAFAIYGLMDAIWSSYTAKSHNEEMLKKYPGRYGYVDIYGRWEPMSQEESDAFARKNII